MTHGPDVNGTLKNDEGKKMNALSVIIRLVPGNPRGEKQQLNIRKQWGRFGALVNNC